MIKDKILAPELKALLSVITLFVLGAIGYAAYLLYARMNALMASYVSNNNSSGLTTMMMLVTILLTFAIFFACCSKFTPEKCVFRKLVYFCLYIVCTAILVSLLGLIGEQNKLAYTAQWSLFTDFAQIAAKICIVGGFAGLFILGRDGGRS